MIRLLYKDLLAQERFLTCKCGSALLVFEHMKRLKSYVLLLFASLFCAEISRAFDDFGSDGDFGFERSGRLEKGFYYVKKDTKYFKLRLTEEKSFGHISTGGKYYKPYDEKVVKAGRKLQLRPSRHVGLSHISNNKGDVLYINNSAVMPAEEYEEILSQKKRKEQKEAAAEQEYQELMAEWESFSKTLKPCPERGDAFVLDSAPAFKYQSNLEELIQIGDNDKILTAFLSKQVDSGRAVILNPSDTVVVMESGKFEGERIVKIVTPGGNVAYMLAFCLGEKPKKK